MNSELNVFFSTSKSYLPHFTVAATSLLENNRDLKLNLFVVHDNLDSAILDIIILFFYQRYQVKLNFINVSHIDFSIFKLTSSYPKYTYFRLFLADLAPGYIEKALFLDSDLVVAGSVRELAEVDMDDEFICAVSEASVKDNVERLQRLGSPAKSYFNAGVILINVRKWRAEKLSKAFVDISNKYQNDLPWVDQDILNIYFANNWRQLDEKFNAVHLIRKRSVTPIIVHYASASKPWHYADTHPYNYLYSKYLALTPFRNELPENFSLKNLVVKKGKLFKRALRELGVLKYDDKYKSID